jgi:hypothetical protein
MLAFPDPPLAVGAIADAAQPTGILGADDEAFGLGDGGFEGFERHDDSPCSISIVRAHSSASINLGSPGLFFPLSMRQAIQYRIVLGASSSLERSTKMSSSL